jgi:hypothetical protein
MEASMRILSVVGAVALLASPALARAAPREVDGTVFVLRSFDTASRTVTLTGETGREQVLRVDDRTLAAVSRLSPGATLLVSYRFNQNAEAEVTLRQVPAGHVVVSEGRVPEARTAGDSTNRVVVLLAEPRAGSLTIRDARGVTQRLAVDAALAEELAALRSGDRVLVDLEAGRVVGITRSR